MPRPEAQDRIPDTLSAIGAKETSAFGIIVMLQISTGKFFTGKAHETLKRALLFTNYRMFRHDERTETQVGSIQPIAGVHGLAG